MRTHLRIVSGSHRGRKLTCNVSPQLRPTPQRTREALFSLLGNAIPERRFFDVFAGTGIVGLEAISRGASSTTFIERDVRSLDDIKQHIKDLKVDDKSEIVRGDAYRWAERWQPPSEPVNIFISPPFKDFDNRMEQLVEMVTLFQEKTVANSIIVLQGEDKVDFDILPNRESWEKRTYGRNHLLIWIKEAATVEEQPQEQE